MKKLGLLCLSCILLIITVSCGCPVTGETSTTTTTTTPAVSGGTLTLYGVDPYTLDPAVAAEATSHVYISQLYGGLLRFDESLQPVGDIAETWDVSDDRLTYTFHLRDDVVFHNGDKVTAGDVKYSWERACTPATGSSVAATYLGDIAGTAAMLSGEAQSISGVTVIDDDTLQVTLTAPRSYFLYKLTYPTAFVVDRKTVEKGGSDWWKEPNGTGPFVLDEWKETESLVLARNDRYHGHVASLDRVEYTLWSGVPMNMYEDGEIDVAGAYVDYIDRINDPDGPFAGQLRVTPELSFSWLGFDTNKAPFDDIHVRRAFALSYDRQKVVDVMYRNFIDTASGILPPGIPGYNEDLAGIGYDVAQAQEELALSRYGSADALPAITLTTSGYGGQASGFLEAAVTDWRNNLGVEVSIRVLEPEYYFYQLKDEKTEMFDMGWIADYPHPQNFLDILFHTGEENNFADYSNPAIDAVLDEAAAAESDAAALELYRQAEQMLIDDVACLPLWFGRNYILVKPYVKNYNLNPMGLVRLNMVTLEK